jgi:hypothetical protein
MINMTEVDSGCYPRDCMKVLAQLGAGRESWWPYKDDGETFKVDPPLKVDRDALLRRIMTYYRLNTGGDFRTCLLQNHPFMAGITVYTDFVEYGGKVEKFGIVPLPQAYERAQGGHAVLVIGYDNDFINSDWAKAAVAAGYPIHMVPKRVYIVRNSWSPQWGNKGDFAIDADYLENWRLCGDCWTQRKYEVGTNNGISWNRPDADSQHGVDRTPVGSSSGGNVELNQGQVGGNGTAGGHPTG